MTSKEIEEALEKISGSIMDGWLQNDMPNIRALHPDAIAIVPLYRSALVVLPQTPDQQARRSVSLLVYHDPGWMGQDNSTLSEHCASLTLYGQRNNVDAVYEEAPCTDGGIFFSGPVSHRLVCKHSPETQVIEGLGTPCEKCFSLGYTVCRGESI